MGRALGVSDSKADIDGGTIDNATIGQTTPAAVKASKLETTSASTIGFYGVAATAQLASAAQTTTAATWVTCCATKGAFATSDDIVTFINAMKQIQSVLKVIGIWKGTA